MNRNPELEAAIIAAPDDPGARMVYGDWLQAVGDPRGEWAAMRAAIEHDPNNYGLRSAAVEFLEAHRKDLLGDGSKVIGTGYVGWSGGFVDEVRLFPTARTLEPERVRDLFRHPTMHFVRHIAIARMETKDAARVVKAISDAGLPLLDELVIFDDMNPGPDATLPVIAKLPLTKLTLGNVHVKKRMSRLRRLTLVQAECTAQLQWVLDGNCPMLERLEIMAGPGLPGDIGYWSEAIGERGVDVEVFAHRALLASTGDRSDPIVDAALTHGRAAVRHLPHAATRLVYASGLAPDDRLRALDIAATLPAVHLGPSTLAGAAEAHLRARAYPAAELRAREALVHTTNEPKLYAIAIDAMRLQGRYVEADKVVPLAKKSMAKRLSAGYPGGAEECLFACMMLYARMRRFTDVIALAGAFDALLRDAHVAVRAIAYLGLGDRARAERELNEMLLMTARLIPTFHHARALVLIEKGNREEARAAIAEAKALGYRDEDWIAEDTRFAGLV
ncbi:MAG: TIGR02996 domain-containing protein [Kofleriaceae bacterium]